jgi:peptidoglycan/xylan/chitin deacetylase (PgdA/CDA1 family)
LAVAFITAGLAAVPTPAGAAPQTVVTLTFDNQWADQMNAVQSLKAHGMAGTFYVISGWLGLPGFLSLSDLKTMAANGNEIGGKTVTNANLPTVSTAEAKREICLGRNVLMDNGFQVTNFAYPFAELNDQVKALVRQCGFNSGRGVGNVNSVGGTDPCPYPDCPYAESIPPGDPYEIDTPADTESNTLLSDLQTEVNDAATHGGGWLVFSFHHICDPAAAGCDPTYSWSPTLFDQFLTWVKAQSRRGVVVKTVKQVIGGRVQPKVNAAAAPAAPIGVNALQNPTLTTVDPYNTSKPYCWTPTGYGSNTPTFAYSTTGGQGGGGQESINMANLTDGDAKLVTNFDLGQCAPTTVTGATYKLGVYYQSDVPVFFTVYQRSATGTWKYLTQSPLFNPTDTPTLATWVTPAVPSTVQGISFGMTIPSNGTLSTSNYSLVRQS